MKVSVPVSFRSQQLLPAAAGLHQSTPATDSLTGRDIGQGVADQVTLIELEPKLLGCLEQEPWPRFAAPASCPRAVGTVQHRIEGAPVPFDFLGHAPVDLLHRRPCYDIAIDNRLVGDDDHGPAGLSEVAEGLKGARQEDELLPGFHVVGPVRVDDPIPIEKGDFHR